MHREKPKTQAEMVEQLWYCLLGTNGGGVVDSLRENNRVTHEVKDELSEFKETRFDTCPMRRSKGDALGDWATRVGIFGTLVMVVLSILDVL